MASPLEHRAAVALESGEPLEALRALGPRMGCLPSLLRGIAYAQLGDLDEAERSLATCLGSNPDLLTQRRAEAARIEVWLERGEAAAALAAVERSNASLRALGDLPNVAMGELVAARAEVLLGRPNVARRRVERLVEELPGTAHALRVVAWLALAETALRTLAATRCRDALRSADALLSSLHHPLLSRTLEEISTELTRPIARLRARARETPTDDVSLFTREAHAFDVEQASDGSCFLVDACRRSVTSGQVTLPLVGRPVLFALLAVLAEAWPGSVSRERLITEAFGLRRINDSHRSRLRVEVGRLRKLLEDTRAEPRATATGYVLDSERDVVTLLPPTGDEAGRLGLLLGDGAYWSARALAEHAGLSVRSAQRTLATLVERGFVDRVGSGGSTRYVRGGVPLASRMLLLGLVTPALDLPSTATTPSSTRSDP